ncbi:hypothetical protein OC834_004591 [Tilletia horrida]|nr:hypothetical protein OC834_004591 [Tilletia horrida]
MEPPPTAPGPSGLNVHTAGIAQVFHGAVSTLTIAPTIAQGIDAIDPRLRGSSALVPALDARAELEPTSGAQQRQRQQTQGEQSNLPTHPQQRHGTSGGTASQGVQQGNAAVAQASSAPDPAHSKSQKVAKKAAKSKPKKSTNSKGRPPNVKFSATTSGKKLDRLWKKKHDSVLARVCTEINDVVTKAQDETGASAAAIRSHCLSSARLRRCTSAWNMLVQYMSRKPDVVRSRYAAVPEKEAPQAWNDYVKIHLKPFWFDLKVQDPPAFKRMSKWLVSLKSLTVSKISTDDVYEKMRDERKFLDRKCVDLETNEAIVQIAFLIHPDPSIKPVISTTPFGRALLGHVMARWKQGDTTSHLLERMNSAVQNYAPKGYLVVGEEVRSLEGSLDPNQPAQPGVTELAQSAAPNSNVARSASPSSASPLSAAPSGGGLPLTKAPPLVRASLCQRSRLPEDHRELVPYVARQLLALLTSQVWQCSEDADEGGEGLYESWLTQTHMSSQLPYVRLFDVLRSLGLCLDGWPQDAQDLLIDAEAVDGPRDGTLEVHAGGLLNTTSWQDRHAIAIADAIAHGHLGLEPILPSIVPSRLVVPMSSSSTDST